MGEDMVYTLQETAEKLKCSLGTVRNMVKRGELHVLKFGRTVRVTATELDRLLKGNTQSDNNTDQPVKKDSE